jgi:hypothetical protein
LDESKLAESGYSVLDFTTIWWSIIDRALPKATGNKHPTHFFASFCLSSWRIIRCITNYVNEFANGEVGERG